MLRAEILCLGNELLIGRTVNKNATEISLELTKMGFKITRITTIRDELDEGIKVLNEIIDRAPEVIIITGGLGPTHDDIQLNVIAKTLNRNLLLDTQAKNMLEKKFRDHPERLNQYRMRMAHLPEGSTPLSNSEGTAPGVHTVYKEINIFSLPGVPREMRAILEDEVVNWLDERYQTDQTLKEYGFDAYDVAEGGIRKYTDKVRQKYPDINFKSHPKKDEESNTYWLSFQTYKISDNSNRVKKAAKSWKETIKKNFPNSKCSEISPVFTELFQPE